MQENSTDEFLQIAQRMQSASKNLVEPKPLPLSCNDRYSLEPSNVSVCYPSTPSDEEWFESELESMRQLWKPYLSDNALHDQSCRKRTYVHDFDWRLDSTVRPERLPDAIVGAGKWESISVPHYGGPIGRATAFYRTVLNLSLPSEDQRLWLHFEGVDYIAKVYFNGNYIGQHEGIVGPFEFDVTQYAHSEEENILLIQVENDAICMGNNMWDSKDAGDKIYAATGPGWDDPDVGWHHCPPGMGIYRKVYFETRPKLFIEDGWVRPLIHESAIELCLEVHSDSVIESEIVADVQVFGKNFNKTVLPKSSYTLNGLPEVGRNYFRIRIPLKTDKLWTPESPWLHSLQVELCDDIQNFAFGMREFRMEDTEEPKGRLYLNNKPVRLRGVNTMGHEQQCVIGGKFDQLLDDLLIYKMLGLNYIRFTQRPVEREILELCDSLGLMVQADLPLFKNLRRNQFNEAVRQTSELERFVRRHPCVVITSFFNEPFPLKWHNALHRHLGKAEVEVFFQSATIAVKQENPDRVIKPVDGDYDPPSLGLPDNHCYTLWYNGHGIPFGKLEAGYWQAVKPGWNYACGEYGAEGLDPVDLMQRRYPSAWLPKTEKEEIEWTPRQIKKAQTGDMYQVFYDRQQTLDDWVATSQNYQAWAVSSMTEAFRRDPRMVSFALHLGIDAFPSGWMKTIVDCERRPKKAFYSFRDALAPILPSLRGPRRFWWSNETFEAELWISNDLAEEQDSLELRAELSTEDSVVATLCKPLPQLAGCDSVGLGMVTLPLPLVEARSNYVISLQVVDKDERVKGHSQFEFDVFAPLVDLPEWDFPSELTESMVERAKGGEVIICGELPKGKYVFNDVEFHIEAIGMGELIFSSRDTGHPLVDGFATNDFRLWYDEEKGYASTFSDSVIVGEGWEPILIAGRGGFGEAWTPLPVVAEKRIGKGRLIINQLKMKTRICKNPPAAIFAQRLKDFDKHSMTHK